MTAYDAIQLVTLDDALQLDPSRVNYYHRQHLNPRLASLLQVVGLDRQYTCAAGPYLWDKDGTRYLDFLAGFGALSLGHNHPRLCAAMDMIKTRPNLIEGLNPLEGALAHNLAMLAPRGLTRVYFANSGAEVVDAAIKTTRAATGRARLVACRNGFHGRTIGALSVTQRDAYRKPFEPLLPDVTFVPFGQIDALEDALRQRDVAAFIVEPIQGEGGIIVPPDGYLQAARELCTRYGTLLVADEVQTGLGRTGALFAVNHDGVVPDLLLLGKALGGGMMPLSAVLTTNAVFRAAHGGTTRTPFHNSTFGGNPRACAAGIAALDVLLSERLSERAAASGAYLMERLCQLQRRQPLIAAVRGRGLFVGVALAPAARGPVDMLTGGLVNKITQMYFTGAIMMHLLKNHHIITTFTLNNPAVLRLEPPLNVERHHLDTVVTAIDETLRECSNIVYTAFRHRSALLRAIFA